MRFVPVFPTPLLLAATAVAANAPSNPRLEIPLDTIFVMASASVPSQLPFFQRLMFNNFPKC